jgi:hypothetical protein
MGQRLDLHELLLTCVSGSQKVYYQPPENLAMTFPCIVYQRDAPGGKFADNGLYLDALRYLVTVIDADPDSVIVEKVKALPLAAFNRHWAANNLNHDAFVVYF